MWNASYAYSKWILYGPISSRSFLYTIGVWMSNRLTTFGRNEFLVSTSTLVNTTDEVLIELTSA